MLKSLVVELLAGLLRSLRAGKLDVALAKLRFLTEANSVSAKALYNANRAAIIGKQTQKVKIRLNCRRALADVATMVKIEEHPRTKVCIWFEWI